MNENSDIKIAKSGTFFEKFHKSPAPMMIIDLHKKCLIKEANSSSAEFLGLGKENVVGKELPRILLGDEYSDDSCIAIKSKFLAGSISLGFKDSSGREKFVEIFSVPVFYEDNYYDLVMLKDLTATKREEKLRRATNLISEAANVSFDLFKLYESVHHIVSDLMPAKNFFMSLVDEEKKTISFPYFVDEIDSPDGPVSLPERPIDSKTLTSYVIRRGMPLLFGRTDFANLERLGVIELYGGDCEEWMGVPLKNNEGKIIGVIVVQRYDDSTRKYDQIDVDTLNFVSNQIAMAIELKKKEEILKESEARYRSLIENLNDIIYIYDIKGNLRYISPAVANYGYSVDELTGKNLNHIVHEEDMIKFKKHTLEVLKGDVQPITVRLYDKQGEIHYFHTINSIIEEDGKKLINGTLSDITERVKIEDELKSSEQKLMEANHAKDRFFSILAHDLKSPFTGILGFSEFLLNDIADLSMDEISEFAGRINSSAKAILELLNNLLDWSRIQSNRLKFVPDEVTVSHILYKVNSVLMPLTIEKGLELILDLDDEIKVMADEDMLQTVFRNLISNSIKFTPRGGSIIVSGELEGDRIRFSVSDSGVGMPPETVAKLFKINELVTTSGTENEKGTGLGLLLCYEFVKRHGGVLDVESRVGEGTTFSFTIPLA